jgi:DNA polymerase-1
MSDTKDFLLYKKVYSVDEIPDIHTAKWVSVDLETDGFCPFLPGREILSVQLSVKEGTGYYLNWNPKVKEEVKKIMENPEQGKTGHNVSKFDRKWFRKAGIRYRGKIFDTLNAAQLLNENLLDKSLDTLTTEFTTLENHKDELKAYKKSQGKKFEFKNVPEEIMVPYGCGDVDAALRLKNWFAPGLKKQGLMPLFNLQMRGMQLFSECEYSGWKIDVPLIDELADIYEKKINNLQRKLGNLNPRSWQQVGAILYDKWDLPAMGKPKKWGGPPSKNTAEDTLLKLSNLRGTTDEQKQFITRLLRYRELSKLLSTYILGLGDLLRPGDFVHANFKLHGAVTGRSSCVDPNLQNIPRTGDIKRLFISRYGERGRLLQVDVSQGELRVAAHRSQEETLLSYFRQGNIDIHRKVAARVLKKSEDKVTTEERKKAKIVNFGILYGGGVDKMASSMGCSTEEAEVFLAKWNAEFPHWKEYVKAQEKLVIRRGYVVSDFGRRRRLPNAGYRTGPERAELRQAVNSPIQGGLFDYTLLCGCDLRDRIKKARIRKAHFLANVHDSWVLDTTEDHVEEISSMMQEVFKHPSTQENFGFEFLCPMDIEVQVSKTNWLEMKTIYPEVK